MLRQQDSAFKVDGQKHYDSSMTFKSRRADMEDERVVPPLPEELWLMVIEHIHPDDLVAFACVHHQSYRLCGPRLAQHRERHMQYGRVSISSIDYRTEPAFNHYWHVMPLLMKIHEDPFIAAYLRQVRLGPQIWIKDPQLVRDMIAQTHSFERLLKHLKTTDSNFAKSIRNTSEIDYDYNDLLLLLLLAMASNVSDLTLTQELECEDWLQDLPTCFQNLLSVQSNNIEPTPEDLARLQKWITLPSIQSVSAIGFSSRTGFYGLSPLHRQHLMELDLRDCDLGGLDLVELLDRLKGLRVVYFEHAHGFEEALSWDADHFISALRECAVNTLHSMTLILHGRPCPVLPSLKGFEALRYLRTELVVLPHVVQHPLVVLDLASCLPIGLEELVLSAWSAWPADEHPVFVATQNASNFPRLSLITLTDGELDSETQKELVKLKIHFQGGSADSGTHETDYASDVRYFQDRAGLWGSGLPQDSEY